MVLYPPESPSLDDISLSLIPSAPDIFIRKYSDLISSISPRWADLQRPKVVNLPSPRPRLQELELSASGARPQSPIPPLRVLSYSGAFSFLLSLIHT